MALRRVHVETGKGGSSGLGPHATPKNHGIVPALRQRGGESFEVPGPLGEHEAVASRVQSGHDVVDNLLGADGVIDKVPVYGGDTTRRRGVSTPAVLKRSGVDIEDRLGW